MAKQSRRRRNAEPKRAEQRQHPQAARKSKAESSSSSGSHPERTVAVLHEAAQAANPASMTNPFQPMERLMQAFMPFAWLRPWMIAVPNSPKLDVIDRDNSVLVRAEVPGVTKTHLAVEASDVAVTIKGEVQRDETREDADYRVSETSRGAFERTVRLPTGVDSTKAKATFKDGVVEVMLPKVDRAKSHNLKL